MTKKTRHMVFIFLAMLPFMAGFHIYAMPHIRLMAPSLFGLKRITMEIYVDPAMTWPQKRIVYQNVIHTRNAITDFFGDRKTNPQIIACRSWTCYKRFGGLDRKNDKKPTSFYSKDHIIKISPDDLKQRYKIRHKLARIELQGRLGNKLNYSKVPIWFTEGLATYLSGNPRFGKLAWHNFIKNSSQITDIQAINTPQNWKKAINTKIPVQILARQEFARWYNETGQSGLLSLLQDIRIGQPFRKAFAKQMQLTLK